MRARARPRSGCATCLLVPQGDLASGVSAGLLSANPTHAVQRRISFDHPPRPSMGSGASVVITLAASVNAECRRALGSSPLECLDEHRLAELACRVGRLIPLVRMTRCGLRFVGSNAAMNTCGGSAMNGRFRVSLFVALWLLAGVVTVTPALARDGDDPCAGARDVSLVNGKIHTLDGRNSIVSSVTIKNGKFTAVGRDERSDDGSVCMRVIDLGGRTAVPGLVDNHNHFLLLGLRPGRDTRLETATSIA